jgi:glycosyltransferase involved in cell wall biosynthesis
MPVVALATTEAHDAVPPGAGTLSTNVEVLKDALRGYMADPDLARETGRSARCAALDRYSLARFLSDWDDLLEEVVT